MNHLNRIYHASIALQGIRRSKTELEGLGRSHEGGELAKALAEAAIDGLQPEAIAEQVVKAMCGNEQMALELMESVGELAKAHIEQHTRTLPNGKTVNVKAYETARTNSMKATANAHGASFHAMRMKSPEAHENAARMHEEAAKQHTEAHEMHPRDVPEVGQEHANLKGQHQMAADFHRTEAQNIRQNEVYSRLKDKAEVASSVTDRAYDTRQKMESHRAAAVAHSKAAEAKPGAGHEEKAEAHHAIADAHEAEYRAHFTKLPYGVVKKAAGASGDAAKATIAAHKANTPDAHMKAAQAHEAAINAHMDVHGEHESDEDGQHGQIAQRHMKLHAYHAQKANKDSAGVPVAKADGCMTVTPTTTDLAKKTGGEALAVEGRPGEKQAKKDEDEAKEELAKSEVHAHTRIIGGKIVSIAAYEKHMAKANDASKKANDFSEKQSCRSLKPSVAHHWAGHLHAESGNYDKAMEHWEKESAFKANYFASSLGLTDDKSQHYMNKAAEASSAAKDSNGHRKAKQAHSMAAVEANRQGNEALFNHHTQKSAEHQVEEYKARKRELEAEVAKSHIEGHTREQGGKIVQVSAYDTHFQGSMKASGAAHQATATAKNAASHASAAAAHMKAADAHTTAAEYAPEGWQKQGHIDNAKLHSHYAQAHHAKAKAGEQKADTGVDTPQHTPQDIKELENHEDYQGFGYLGSEHRSERSDKALVDAANRAGVDKHYLAAWALSAAGRHGIHTPKHEGDHEKMVAHYQRQLTDAKIQKGFGLKEYAEDLKGRKPEKK